MSRPVLTVVALVVALVATIALLASLAAHDATGPAAIGSSTSWIATAFPVPPATAPLAATASR